MGVVIPSLFPEPFAHLSQNFHEQRSQRIQTAGQSNNCPRSHTTDDRNRPVGRQPLFLPNV